MFGFSKKRRASSGIEEGVGNIVSNRDLQNECFSMCGTDEGGKELHRETIAQLINALAFVFSREYEGTKSWYTTDFLKENMIRGIEANHNKGPRYTKAIMDSVINLQAATGGDIEDVYRHSAGKVLKVDDSVSKEDIVDFIESQVESFILETAYDYVS